MTYRPGVGFTRDYTMITEPIISVDRQSQRCAVFDGFKLVRGFLSYTVEDEAVAEAKEWLKFRATDEPQIVYPRITSVRVLSTKV